MPELDLVFFPSISRTEIFIHPNDRNAVSLNHPSDLIRPNTKGINSELQAAVHTMDATISQNTRRVFLPKLEAFIGFCDNMHGDKPSPRLLTSE
jgi:hypothetical protein